MRIIDGGVEMKKEECAIIMAYTGTCMLTGDNMKYFYEYLSKLYGRPVYTHEISQLADDIKKKSEKDFIDLCRNAGKEKQSKWLIYDRNSEEQYVECTNCHLTSRPRHLYGVSEDGQSFPNFCPNCGAEILDVVRGVYK